MAPKPKAVLEITDPIKELWCAVLERAYHDAMGELTGLSGTIGWMTRRAMIKEAQVFLTTQNWIYDLCDIDKSLVMATRPFWKKL